jgi:hypothetical protein
MSYFDLNIDTENLTNIECSRGDIFDVSITYLDENGDPMDFTGYTIKAEVKKSHDSAVFATFQESDGTLEINENEIRLLKESFDLPPSAYVWSLRMTNNDGSERIHRGIIQVNP